MAASSVAISQARASTAFWCLTLGAIANVAFLLEGYLDARLDPQLSFVSELGGRGEPAGWFFRLADFTTGVMLFIGAVALWSLLPRLRILRLGLLLSMVFATLTAVDAFLPLDCPPTVDAACRAREAAGDVSWQHALHNVTGVVESIAAAAAMILLGIGMWAARRQRRLSSAWESIAQQMIIAGLLYALLSLAISVMYLVEAGPIGTVQRLQIATYAAGMLLLGLAARRMRPSFQEVLS